MNPRPPRSTRTDTPFPDTTLFRSPAGTRLRVVDQQRSGDQLTLTWQAPANLPFPMPVEVQVDGKVTRLPMTGGTGTLAVPAGAHVVLDPWDRKIGRAHV